MTTAKNQPTALDRISACVPLEPGTVSLVEGSNDTRPAALAYQICARAMGHDRPLVWHRPVTPNARFLDRLTALVPGLDEARISHNLRTAVVEPAHRTDLIRALVREIVPGSVVLIDDWVRLSALVAPKDIHALSVLARKTHCAVLVCAGYKRARSLYARPALMTAWRQYANVHVNLRSAQSAPAGRPLPVDYRVRGEQTTAGRLWLDSQRTRYTPPERATARVREVPGHEGRVHQLAFA